MTKEEWVELFQAMNGRDPLPKEFLDAKEAGEFQELPSLTELGEEVAQVQDKPSKESWVELFQALHGRDPLPKEFLEAKERGEFTLLEPSSEGQSSSSDADELKSDLELSATFVSASEAEQGSNLEASGTLTEESDEEVDLPSQGPNPVATDAVSADSQSSDLPSVVEEIDMPEVVSVLEGSDSVSSQEPNPGPLSSVFERIGSSEQLDNLDQFNEKAALYTGIAAEKVKAGGKVAFEHLKKGANTAMTTLREKQEEQRLLDAQFKDRGSYFDGGMLEYIVYSIGTYFLTLITFGLALPWAICLWYDWETRHTVIEGRRLRFSGTGMQLLGNWIKWLLLTFITFGIYGFWTYIKLKQWIAKHTHFAD